MRKNNKFIWTKMLCWTLLAGGLIACSASIHSQLTGNWIQPIPGQENQVQGFSLYSDGTARSINSATLLYESWSLSGDTLSLNGLSSGNGQTIAFTKKYTFSFLNPGRLVLTDENGAVFTFNREK